MGFEYGFKRNFIKTSKESSKGPVKACTDDFKGPHKVYEDGFKVSLQKTCNWRPNIVSKGLSYALFREFPEKVYTHVVKGASTVFEDGLL